MLQVNFLPWRERQLKRRCLHALGLFILYSLIVFFVLALVYRSVSRENQRLTREVLLSEAVHQERRNDIHEREQLMQQIQRHETLSRHIDSLRQPSRHIAALFQHTEQILPEAMWLKSLSIQNNNVFIHGLATHSQSILDFYRRMQTLAFIDDLQLGTISILDTDGYAFSLMAKWQGRGRE